MSEGTNAHLVPKDDGIDTPSTGLKPNLFDFLDTSDIVHDPNINEYIKRITQGPVFNQIAEQLQNMFKGVHAVEHYYSTMPDFDYNQYYSTMHQVMEHPLFTTYAERLLDVLLQDPSIPGVLEKLKSPRKAHIKTGHDLKSTIKEIENGDPAAMIKYLHDKGILQKMTEAEGFAAGGETDSSDDHTTSKVCYSNRTRRHLNRLHRACKVGEVERAEVLLVSGTKLEVRDKDGNTPLHYAAAYGQKECVELLLKYGASVIVYNVHEQTPVDVAKLNNHNEIAKLILDTVYL